MRRLAPGGLALSPGLQAADPAQIAHWAAGTRSAAQVLEAGASRLAGWCSAVPGGSWLSPAASVFDGAGQEQARRMRVVAGLFGQLALAASQLAAALTAAREQALAVVARGARIDDEVQAFNGRLRAQHALLAQDPDSLLASEPAADELSGRLVAAAGELADAEAGARSAWQAAAAAFDVVAYATPAMRQRMSAPDWDPAKEVSLAAARSPVASRVSCGPMETLGLPLNGGLTGPDGRAYPLVVQTGLGEDGKLLVTTQERPADREGWTRLAVRVGTTSYGRKAATWEKIAVALGGAAGAAYPSGATFEPGLLDRLHIMPAGGAHLSGLPKATIDAVKEASAEAPRGQEVASYWVAPESGLAGGLHAVVPDAIGLFDGVLAGYVLAHHLDDGRAADYRVVFEENAAGQRRARMQLFRVLNVPGEQPRALAEGGYVDASGQLAGIPTTGEAPGAVPVMIAAAG
ncbi:MAG TPA: hypothetical protein VHX15_01375 [Frankiaceae bacterium]|jgi:hypothetical protein|nr:hypothetical protein [Frankiaceae bacterium]